MSKDSADQSGQELVTEDKLDARLARTDLKIVAALVVGQIGARIPFISNTVSSTIGSIGRHFGL